MASEEVSAEIETLEAICEDLKRVTENRLQVRLPSPHVNVVLEFSLEGECPQAALIDVIAGQQPHTDLHVFQISVRS